MPRLDEYIPEDVKRQAAEETAEPPGKGPGTKPKAPKQEDSLYQWNSGGAGKRQRGLFKKKRAGEVLTREEVRAIKKGRKKLRREMKSQGLRSRQDFEITAESLGLYFDKNSSLWPWLFSHWLGALLAALAALLLVLFLFAAVIHVRGFFTINLAESLSREGFTLSETEDFANPTIQLLASPTQGAPCISINQIPADVDSRGSGAYDSRDFFAYTFWVRNEGDNTNSYTWSFAMNSESRKLSDSVWAILFVDGEMRVYAKANQMTGEAEALPALDNDRYGYLTLPVMELSPDSGQFQVVRSVGSIQYYRVIPEKFVSEEVIAQGGQKDVEPGEAHKFTVVLWMEGDDIDTTDEKIGGHLGVEIRLEAENTEDRSEGGQSLYHSVKNYFSSLWSHLVSG